MVYNAFDKKFERMIILKKLVTGTIVGIILALGLNSMAEYVDVAFNKIKVTVNGSPIQADNVLINGRTYVPLRSISEILNKDVTWDEKTATAGINDKDFIDKQSAPGYSRAKPADINSTIKFDFQDSYISGTLEKKKYSSNILVKEILRGDIANKMIKDTNPLNDEPDAGFDYLVAKIEFELTEAPDQYDLNTSNFKLISEKGKEYNSKFVVSPKPSLTTKLYKGSKNEGYVVFTVEITDSKPLITFGRDYNGNGGVWFKAY